MLHREEGEGEGEGEIHFMEETSAKDLTSKTTSSPCYCLELAIKTLLGCFCLDSFFNDPKKEEEEKKTTTVRSLPPLSPSLSLSLSKFHAFNRKTYPCQEAHPRL